MANSGTVTAGSAALASQYNNLRDDVLNVTTGHTHTGASENGAKVAATGVSSGTAANGAVLTADGSGAAAFLALAGTGADVQEFTSSGSWVKPAGKSAVYVFAIGGGGGGNGGAKAGSGDSALGGSGGNGAGDAKVFFRASALPGTVTVTIGAGGAGGTARTTTGTQVNGAVGGTTTFGTAVTAIGGFPAGTAADGYSSIRMPVGRTTMESASDNVANPRTVPGTSPNTTLTLEPPPNNGSLLNGGVGNYSQSIYGRSSHDLLFGAAGGGAGGEKQSTDVANVGGAGGRGFGFRLDTAAAGGTANGGAATAAGTAGFGNGGAGGGAGSASTNGGAGSNGALGGGGGGGGGAQSGNSGAGGTGGNGYVLVISV